MLKNNKYSFTYKLKNFYYNIINELKNINYYDITAIFITLFFLFIFSLFSILQYFSLGDSAYDLGLHANVLYNFLHGKSFFTPLLDENFLSEHFSPIEFLEVPVYYIYSSPVSLLILENFFVSFAGLIVYGITKIFFKDRISSKFAIGIISLSFLFAYEMSPYTQSLVSFPFHNMAFLPFFFFLAIYSFLSEKRILHFFSLAMIISLHSSFIYIVAIILLYELFFLRTYKGKNIKTWLSNKYEAHSKVNIIYFVIFIIVLYGYLIFSSFMKGYLSGVTSISLAPGTGASGVVSSSPIGLAILLFKNPHLFIDIISINLPSKYFFVMFSIKNFVLLPFFSPLALILTLPYMLYAFPSSYTAYYELGYQYSSMLIVPIIIASIIGLYNIMRLINFIKNSLNKKYNKIKNINIKKINNRFITIVAIIIIITSLIIIQYGIISPGNYFKSPYNSAMVNINDMHVSGAYAFLINVSSNIPGNSYILTENSLMPYFSNHINIYSTPYTPHIYNNLSRFQYIIIQYNSFWATTTISSPSLQEIAYAGLSNGTYHIISEYKPADIFVLEKSNK